MDSFKLEAKERVHKPCKLVGSFFYRGTAKKSYSSIYVHENATIEYCKWIAKGEIQVFCFWSIYM